MVPGDFPPLYSVGEDGTVSGFAIDLFNEIADRAGFHVEYVVEPGRIAGIQAVVSGDADVFPLVGVRSPLTDALDLTPTLLTYPVSLYVRTGTNDIFSQSDFAGKTVVVQARTPAAAALSNRRGVKVLAESDYRVAILKFISGRGDVLAYPRPVVEKVLRDLDNPSLFRMLPDSLIEVRLAVAMHRGRPEIAEPIKAAATALIGSAEYADIFKTWYGPAVPFWSAAKIFIVAVVFLILVAGAMAGWRYRSVMRLNRELQAAYGRLAMSEERLEVAIAGSDAGIWSRDLGTDTSYRSARWWEILQYEPDELGGNRDTFLGLVHPDDRDKVVELGKRYAQSTEPFRHEFRIRRKNGTYIWVENAGSAIADKDGRVTRVSGTMIDITDRKRAEIALRESEMRFRDIADFAADWFWEMDKDLRYTYMSRRFFEMTGFSPTDILGKTRRELAYNLEPVGQLEERMRVMEDHKPFRDFRYEFLAADGTRRYATASGKPHFDADGEFAGYRGATTDITRQVEAERAAQLAQAQFQQAQKMETVGQLTGGVAHDFNNILTVISGSLQLLSDRLGDKPDLKRFADRALNAADRGAGLTQRMLAFSRKQTLQPTPIDLGDLVRDTIDMIRQTTGEAIELAVEADPEPWICEVDPIHIQNVLLNLVVNSRDAMPDGGTLTIKTGHAEFKLGDETAPTGIMPGRYAALTVTDTGIGIPPENLGSVFEPFFTTKEVGAGSGLGLSMAYGFVKQSGGHLSIDSEVGVGTTVHIFLPEAKNIAVETEAPEDDGDEPRAHGETILVVEDDEDVCDLSATILNNLGYRVFTAESGPDALKLLDGNPDIDLLLTDVMLPKGMTGRELAEKAVAQIPGLKTVFMSGYTKNALSRDGRLEEGIQLLEKPFSKVQLANKLREVLDERDAAA